MKLDWNCYTAPNNGTAKIMDNWTVEPLFNLLFWVPLGKTNKYAQAAWGNSAQDNAPGGTFGTVFGSDPGQYSESDFAFLLKEAMYLLTGSKRTGFYQKINRFTMMPSYSAADLRFPTKNLYMKWDDQYLCGKTPFDYVYAPPTNEEHVLVSAKGSQYFENEVRCANIDLPKFYNSQIVGSNSICTNPETYLIQICNNVPMNISWTVTPAGLVTPMQIGNQVKLTRIGSATGIITLTATIGCGNAITISKQVTVGSPPISISSSTNGCSGQYQQWNLVNNTPGNGSNWNWSVSSLGTNSQITINSPNSPSTSLSVKGGGTVRLSYTDLCGVAKTDGVTVYSTCPSFALSVSPNPAQTDINVSLIPSDNSKLISTATENNSPLRVVESNGKTIMSLFDVNTNILVKQWKKNEAKNPHYTINIQGIKKGVYVLQVDRDNQTTVTKIIIK